MTNDEKRTREETRRRQRAVGFVALGLVHRVGDRFLVEEPSFQRTKPFHFAWRDHTGRVRCTCPDYEAHARRRPKYRCVHILAAKHAVETGRVREGERELTPTPAPGGKVLSFEAHRTLRRHVQAAEEGRKRRAPAALAKVAPELPWHAVADTLDAVAPTWSHHVEEITPYGTALLSVTASITIRGVTHRGTGRGSSRHDLGLQRAEQQALKHAAIQFPEIAAALIGGPVPPGAGGLPRRTRGTPQAKTLSTIATPGQKQTINDLADRLGLDPEQLSRAFHRCALDTLNKRAASTLVTYLLSLVRMRESGDAPLRLAS